MQQMFIPPDRHTARKHFTLGKREEICGNASLDKTRSIDQISCSRRRLSIPFITGGAVKLCCSINMELERQWMVEL